MGPYYINHTGPLRIRPRTRAEDGWEGFKSPNGLAEDTPVLGAPMVGKRKISHQHFGRLNEDVTNGPSRLDYLN